MGNCFNQPAKCAHASSSQFQASGVVPAATGSSQTPSSYKEAPFENVNHSGVASKVDLSISNYLKSFSFNDLKTATKNFREENLLGEGGFGCVFKGWIDEITYAPTRPGTGIVVAVKRLKAQSFQGHKEWLTEVNYLGQLRHENLVKLIGHCLEAEHKLLVYEFMPKGSLENHLFRKGVQPISWTTRMKIAGDVARGLAFLHGLDAKVIYRDLKASNVLLDSDFNAKLSDFGLARDGPTGDNTHVSTRVVGTQGYAAPEYVATGHLNPKSDVYSFGVVLLELLTGKRALDEAIGGLPEESLVEWALPFLKDNKRVLRIMDTRLGGQYSKKGVYTAAAIALECLNSDSKSRPAMNDVLSRLEEISTSNNVLSTPPHVRQDNPGTKYTNHPRRTTASPM